MWRGIQLHCAAMRVLLPTVYATRGGSTRILLATAAVLRGEHEVTLRAPLDEADEHAPVLFPDRPLVGLLRKLGILPRLLSLICREALVLRRLRPDVIHLHDEPSLYVYGVAARCLRPRPLILWHLHLDPSRGGVLARLRGRLADACVTISPHIPSPASLPSTLVRNPLSLSNGATEPHPDPLAALAVVGAIYPQKGQDLAVEALALLRCRPEARHARLMLIGPELDGAYAAALRERIARLGLGEVVRFTGARPPEHAFDDVGLALFPSQSEIQPLALAEALGRGFRVVASSIPAHRVMIEETGADPASLSPRNPEAFAEAILKAASGPIRADVAPRVRALYAPAAFSDAILSLYRNSLTRPAPFRDTIGL